MVDRDSPMFGKDLSPEEYDRWVREKVEASLADPRPSIPQEQVSAEVSALLADMRRKRQRRR